MQTKKPDVANVDDFIGKAALIPNGGEDQSVSPVSSAPDESNKDKAPRTTRTTKPRTAPAEAKEDPLVHLNVEIPLSMRDWLNIIAIKKRKNLGNTLVEILEKHRVDYPEQ